MLISALRDFGISALETSGIDDASFEATELLCAALKLSRSSLFASLSENATENQEERYRVYITRRISGEPLQYIIGEWSFYKYDFFVGKGALIPRPETEELTEICSDFVKKHNCKTALDLCSGTGCIGLCLARETPSLSVTLVEKYDEALSVLEKNVQRHNIYNNVKILKRDILIKEEFAPEYDLIVSNPPYVESGEIPSLQKEVLFEPLTALDGGKDGLIFYRAIREIWFPALRKGGLLALECGENQTEAVAEIFSPYETEILRDIYSNPRMVLVKK